MSKMSNSNENPTTNDDFEYRRNDQSSTTTTSRDLSDSQSRGTKRPLLEMAGNESQRREDDSQSNPDDWDPERDEFLRKIKEIKKLKARDAHADRMRGHSQRKSDRWHYVMEERLETIKENGEPDSGVGWAPAPQESQPIKRNTVVSSPMQKTHSQIVRCKIPVNVAKAAPTPPTSPPSRSIMYQRLQSEHLQLQRSFALLKQLVAESCGTQQKNDAMQQAKWEDEKKLLLQTTKQLQNKVKDLQDKLNEYQEQNELLEFRILELDHCKGFGSPAQVRDNGSNTEYCSTSSGPSGHSPCNDSFEEQVARCQDLDLQVDALQEELSKISALPGLTCIQRRALAHSASCVRKCKLELVMLWDRVSSLASQMDSGLEAKKQPTRKMEQTFQRGSNDALDIEDIIKNLQKLESELHEEEGGSLTDSQIRDLTSSKTESELDMSLSSSIPESEAPSLVHADNGGLCFDCTVAKEGVRNLTRRMMECSLVNHPRSQVPGSDGAGEDGKTASSDTAPSPSEDEGLGDDRSRSGPDSLTDFEVSGTEDSEERRHLQSRLLGLSRSLRLTEDVVAQLRTDLSLKEEQISRLLADNCPKTILELEERFSICETNRAELQEQVLELEEAENDARLESQNLRVLVDNLKRHEAELDGQLDAARNGLDEYERQVMAMEVSDDELRTQISYLEQLVFKYEEHVADLERNETELRRKLMELEREREDKDRVLIKDLRDAQVEAMVSTADGESQTEPQQNGDSQSGNLLDRLLQLEAKDDQLQDQLHQMDSANLKLWQKLQDVDAGIDQCRKMDDSSMDVDDRRNRSPAERLDDLLLTIPASTEELTTGLSPSVASTLDRKPSPSDREGKLRERLFELENINRDFEKELGVREKLCRKKETECREWASKESKINAAIASLRRQEESLSHRISELETQKGQLRFRAETVERERAQLVEMHREQVAQTRRDHEETVSKMKERLRQLEGQEEARSSTIEDMERGLNLNSVRAELVHLKSEQAQLRTTIVRQTSEMSDMVDAFKAEVALLIESHSREEASYERQIDDLRNREESFRLEIGQLSEQKSALERELRQKREELDTVKRDFDKKMLLLEEEHHLVENELKWKLREMEDGTTVAVKALEAKRKQLELSLQDDLKDLRIQEDSYKGRIQQLEKHVDTLRQEVTSIASTSTFEAVEREREESLQVRGCVPEDTFESDDQSLGERITELEKKEAAYLETLENADRIIHRMELNYKQKIDDLESTERSLRTKLTQMEENEKILKESLQSERKSTDGWKVSDLVKELMEAESRENALKEHADGIETSLKSLSQKAKELERTNRQLRDELREHDELLLSLNAFKEKLEAAKDEIAKLKSSESALKETLRQADSMLVHREMGLMSKVDELEKEKREMKEVLEQLRSEVKVLNEKLETTQYEKSVLERSASEHSQWEQRVDELESAECDLRLEVTRLRQCLSASKAHLSDLETVRKNQDFVIESLEEEKTVVIKKLEEQTSFMSNGQGVSVMNSKHIKACQEQMENQQTAQAFLLQRVAQLENALKYHQARLQSDTSPVSLESSYDESSGAIDPVMIPFPSEKVEDDVFNAGLEERIKLEECVSRAMEAMERDLKENQSLPATRLSISGIRVSNEACLTSPNSPSTSGCESDAGSECCRSNGEEGWESDHSENLNFPGESPRTRSKILNLPRKHVVKTKELPSPVKTRIIYPTFSKAAVQEEAVLFTGHSLGDIDAASSRITFGDNPEPPQDFQILRQVGKDSLLVGWSPPVRFCRVQCYQIFVDDQLHQHVRSPDRTKALLHKLDLASKQESFNISIQTVSLDGRLSRPAAVCYDPFSFTPVPEKETAVVGETSVVSQV